MPVFFLITLGVPLLVEGCSQPDGLRVEVTEKSPQPMRAEALASWGG